MYAQLKMPAPDALHGVMAKYAADSRSDKMDLGVGVYRDLNGKSTILKAIQIAAGRLLVSETTKSYTPLRGDEGFLAGMQQLVGGTEWGDRVAKIQTVGGTGGIRLALELAAMSRPSLTVNVGAPTWPNHLGISKALGLKVKTFQYFDKAAQRLNVQAFKDTIESGEQGDIIVFHGPCHNPSGADLEDSEYWELMRAASARGMIPLIDAAYYGLGNELSDDLARLRNTIAKLSTAFVVMSCSKAFGMYRERTGVLFAVTPSATTASIAQAHLEMIGRKIYSMPPSHGAKLVAEVLHDSELRNNWTSELSEMRSRVLNARQELHHHSTGMHSLSCVSTQKGIFSLLPIGEDVVSELATKHGIYMPSSGRINVAGLKHGDAERFTHALSSAMFGASGS